MQTQWKTHAILDRLQAELGELAEEQQFRKLSGVEGINLCSNDSLGLSDDPRLRAGRYSSAPGRCGPLFDRLAAVVRQCTRLGTA